MRRLVAPRVGRIFEGVCDPFLRMIKAYLRKAGEVVDVVDVVNAVNVVVVVVYAVNVV